MPKIGRQKTVFNTTQLLPEHFQHLIMMEPVENTWQTKTTATALEQSGPPAQFVTGPLLFYLDQALFSHKMFELENLNFLQKFSGCPAVTGCFRVISKSETKK